MCVRRCIVSLAALSVHLLDELSIICRSLHELLNCNINVQVNISSVLRGPGQPYNYVQNEQRSYFLRAVCAEWWVTIRCRGRRIACFSWMVCHKIKPIFIVDANWYVYSQKKVLSHSTHWKWWTIVNHQIVHRNGINAVHNQFFFINFYYVTYVIYWKYTLKKHIIRRQIILYL